jgi:hypothetical protein
MTIALDEANAAQLRYLASQGGRLLGAIGSAQAALIGPQYAQDAEFVRISAVDVAADNLSAQITLSARGLFDTAPRVRAVATAQNSFFWVVLRPILDPGALRVRQAAHMRPDLPQTGLIDGYAASYPFIRMLSATGAKAATHARAGALGQVLSADSAGAAYQGRAWRPIQAGEPKLNGIAGYDGESVPTPWPAGVARLPASAAVGGALAISWVNRPRVASAGDCAYSQPSGQPMPAGVGTGWCVQRLQMPAGTWVTVASGEVMDGSSSATTPHAPDTSHAGQQWRVLVWHFEMRNGVKVYPWGPFLDFPAGLAGLPGASVVSPASYLARHYLIT